MPLLNPWNSFLDKTNQGETLQITIYITQCEITKLFSALHILREINLSCYGVSKMGNLGNFKQCSVNVTK